MIKRPLLIFLGFYLIGMWLLTDWQVVRAYEGTNYLDSGRTITSYQVVPDPASIEPLTWLAGVLLALALAGVALALMLMAAHRFSERLNREMPQPIYTQETRLLKVIEDSVKAIIHQTMDNDRATGQEREVQVGFVEFERTANAGINLKLNADTVFKADDDQRQFRQLQTWRIEADRWGRIYKMLQDGVPRYIAIETILLPVAELEDGQENGHGQLTPPTNGHLLPPGEHAHHEEYVTQSETCISVISRRKSWGQ